MGLGSSIFPLKKTARFVRLPVILSAAVMILPACRKNEATKSPASTTPPRITRSQDRSQEATPHVEPILEESADPYAPSNLIKLPDSGIVKLCENVIASGNLTPEMENANRLEDCLFQLALRNGPALYEVMSLLPPGWHSENLVKSTFMRTKFASFADALAKAEPIKESDLFRAALEGAFSNYQMSQISSSLSGREMSLGLDIPQLRGLKGNGLSDEYFSKLLISGVAIGDFDLNHVMQELDLGSQHGNIIMSEIVRRLPSEAVKEVFEEAISRGDKLDLASVFRFASSLSHQDPEASISWLATLPGENAFYGTRSFFNEWTAAAPMQASARIGTMEAGPLKDAAIEGLIHNSVANGAIDEADEWSAVIQDEAVKKRVDESIEKARSARQIRK